MFKKREDFAETVDSLIGENIKVIGRIEGLGNLRIDGIIEGDIDYKGDITIGETGSVKGNIKADNILLAGSINGNLNVKSKLEVLEAGILVGDIEVATIVLHENGKFDGNCKMTTSNLSEIKDKIDSKAKA